MDSVFSTINSILDSVPDKTLIYVLIGLLISVGLQFFKRWLSIQSDKVITFMLGAFSFIVVAIDYLISQAAQNPSILGGNTLMFMGATTTLYHYVVKPMTNIVRDAKAYREAPNVIPTEDGSVVVPAATVAAVATPSLLDNVHPEPIATGNTIGSDTVPDEFDA